MSSEKHHIVPYSTFVYVLIALLILTGLSVLITNYNLGELAVAGALFFAVLKSTLVLVYFMHLKFDKSVYRIMVGFVLAVFIAVIAITFFDYLFR